MPLRVFPVAMSSPRPTFSDDWGKARSGGRRHAGTDIFAPRGTHVLAVDSGTLRHGTSKLGGLVAHLTADDGTYYYFAHLDEQIGATPRRVEAGDPIGRVGETGNALGTSPHLHFEIHPNNGAAINPFPFLSALEPRSVIVLPGSPDTMQPTGPLEGGPGKKFLAAPPRRAAGGPRELSSSFSGSGPLVSRRTSGKGGAVVALPTGEL